MHGTLGPGHMGIAHVTDSVSLCTQSPSIGFCKACCTRVSYGLFTGQILVRALCRWGTWGVGVNETTDIFLEDSFGMTLTRMQAPTPTDFVPVGQCSQPRCTHAHRALLETHMVRQLEYDGGCPSRSSADSHHPMGK